MTRSSFRFCPLCRSRLRKDQIDGRKRSICPQCGWIQYENPLPSVAALVWNSADEILLVKRGIMPGKGRWALPSGFIEVEETPEEACIRELEEETGLKGRILYPQGVFNQRSLMYKNVIIVGYTVEAEGRIRPGSDAEECGYFSLQDLPEIAFSSHREMIFAGLEGRRS